MFLLFVRYLHDEHQDVLENDKKIFLMTDWGEGFYFIYSYMKIGNEFKILTRSKLDFDWKSRSWSFAYII